MSNWGPFFLILWRDFARAFVIILIVTFWVKEKKRPRSLFRNDQRRNLDHPGLPDRCSRNSVRYFNLSDISNVKTVDGGNSMLLPPKRTAAGQGVDQEILDGKQAPQYLQTDVIFHQEKRQVPSFLKISKADPSKVSSISKAICSVTKAKRKMGRASHFSTEGDFAQAVKANGVARRASRSASPYCR
jgi:hypothetical protein